MPNQPSAKNVQRGLRVRRVLDAKVLKKFRVDEQMSVKDAYILALDFATEDVVLSASDHERIAREIRAAEQNAKKRRGA